VLDRRGPGGGGGRPGALRFRGAGGASNGRLLPISRLMPRSISRCPKCREPVSQFAAGCAVCGTDIQAARAELAERRAKLSLVGLVAYAQIWGGLFFGI
jgi:hypothetical protein